MKPEITVVICTFNRYDLLPEAIASIELQDFADEAYELIVVDNSDDLAGRERFLDGLEIACNHSYISDRAPAFPGRAISAQMPHAGQLSLLWTTTQRRRRAGSLISLTPFRGMNAPASLAGRFARFGPYRGHHGCIHGSMAI
jgi:glycosyl transferase family 2